MKLYKRAKKGEKLAGLFSYISDIESNLSKVCQAHSAESFTNIN